MSRSSPTPVNDAPKAGRDLTDLCPSTSSEWGTRLVQSTADFGGIEDGDSIRESGDRGRGQRRVRYSAAGPVAMAGADSQRIAAARGNLSPCRDERDAAILREPLLQSEHRAQDCDGQDAEVAEAPSLSRKRAFGM